jgi:hypothetical protein
LALPRKIPVSRKVMPVPDRKQSSTWPPSLDGRHLPFVKVDKENQKVTDGVLEKHTRDLDRLQTLAQCKGVFTVRG